MCHASKFYNSIWRIETNALLLFAGENWRRALYTVVTDSMLLLRPVVLCVREVFL